MNAKVEQLRLDGRKALLQHDMATAEAAFVDALKTVDDDHRELLLDLYRDLARVCELSGRFRQAMDLNRAVELLGDHLRSHPALSIPRVQRLVDSSRADPGKRSDLGYLLHLLASKERFESGGFPSAREHMEESVVIGVELEPDSRETLIRQAFLAALRAMTNDLDGAVQIVELIRGRLFAEEPGTASGLLRTIAQIRLREGDLDGAEADTDTAIAVAASAAAEPEEAAALSVLGMVRSHQGDAEAAIELYTRALRLAERQPGGSVPSAVNLSRLGDQERARGDFTASAGYLTRAVRILEEHAPNSDELGQALSDLSTTRYEAGQFGPAATALRASLRLTADPTERVRRTVRLGVVLKDIGLLTDARRALDDALAEASTLDRPELVNMALTALAGVHRRSGDLDEAEQIYERLVAAVTPESPDYAYALSNLAGVAYDRQEFAIAADRYRSAFAAIADPDDLIVRANLQHNLATALEGQRLFAEADELYAEVLRTAPGLSRMQVEAASGRAGCAFAEGRLDDAVTFAGEAVRLAERLRATAGGETSRSSLFSLLQRHYAELLTTLRLRGADGDAEAGVEVAELCRARTLEERLRRSADSSFPESRTEAPRLRQRLAATSRRLLEARANPDIRESVLAELRRQERELTTKLEDLEGSSDRDGVAVLTTAEIMAALPADTALIEFQVVADAMFVWTISSEGVHLSTLACDVEELGDLVLRAVGPYHSADAGNTSDAQAWEELRTVLHEPIKETVENTARLFVSPDGPLHYLSLGPLLDRPIVYVPSATIGLRRRQSRAARPVELDFVGLGNPAFDRTLPEFADLPPLPGAEVEVAEIAELFGDRGLALSGAEANEPELRSWIRRCRYLHIATHGLVDTDNPMRSGLVLAGPAIRNMSEPDDMLHAYEMIDLRIEAELVVCAACHTGFGRERYGEGLATIGSALLQGGAHWVLVTLWPVGDLVTVAFMRVLYEALLDGVAVPDAVERARDEIRADHADPYWWASFILFGVQP